MYWRMYYHNHPITGINRPYMSPHIQYKLCQKFMTSKNCLRALLQLTLVKYTDINGKTLAKW